MKIATILLITWIVLSGCAAANYNYKLDNTEYEIPSATHSISKIHYSVDSNHALEESFKRIFLNNFKDIQLIKIEDDKNSVDRFVVHCKIEREDPSLASKVFMCISVFSFSVVPSVIKEKVTVTFDVVAPNGKNKIFKYNFEEQFFNWLPLGFFSPDLVFFLINGMEDTRKYEKVLDQITSRFIADSTPFFLAQSQNHVEEND